MQYKTLIPRPGVMECPWKQQKILSMKAHHLCGFLVFCHHWSSHRLGLWRQTTVITPALLLLCHHITRRALARWPPAIIPLANQYPSNQHFSFRLGSTALRNTSIQIFIFTDGIQTDSSGKKSTDTDWLQTKGTPAHSQVVLTPFFYFSLSLS